MSVCCVLKDTNSTGFKLVQCDFLRPDLDLQSSFVSLVPPMSNIQEIRSTFAEPKGSCTYGVKESLMYSQEQLNFPKKQGLDISDMHPQILPWENESPLQVLSSKENYIKDTSSNFQSYDKYQTAQPMSWSQNLLTPVTEMFLDNQLFVVPSNVTTHRATITNVTTALPNTFGLEEWVQSDGNQTENQTVPIAPNVFLETQSNKAQNLTINTHEPTEDVLLNYENNCSSSLSLSNMEHNTIVNISPQITAAPERSPEYEDGLECYNYDSSQAMTTLQSHNTGSLSDKNYVQVSPQDNHYTQPHNQPYSPSQVAQLKYSSENSRLKRNQAEKQRRDALNRSITELTSLVPQVAQANRKLDKISVLRLSGNYLRTFNHVFRDVTPTNNPEFSASSVQAALNVLKGFLLSTTYRGIVVLVSKNILGYLGYNEIDLLGTNVLDIVHIQDRYIMIEQLTPKSEMIGANGELLLSGVPGADEMVAQQLGQDIRNFVVRFKKFCHRTAQPVYVTCLVEGSFRKADGACGFVEPPVRRTRTRTPNPFSSGNDIVFVGIVRPVVFNIRAEARVESFYTEYLTTHSIDGEIIDCDKRISLATGYMTQEVMGINAMNFMHRDDVHWVVIALQEMYDQCKMFSESYYRLMIKNGDFVYMRTRGYLQVDDLTGVVTSLVCNNTIIDDEEEGQSMLKMMKDKYSSKFNPEEIQSPSQENLNSPVAVADPKNLLNAILRILRNLPHSPNDFKDGDTLVNFSNPTGGLTYKPPEEERITSAIQKMYTFIKTFKLDLRQAQIYLSDPRSIINNTNDHHCQVKEISNDEKLPQLDSSITVEDITNINKEQLTTNNGAQITMYNENETSIDFINFNIEDEFNKPCYSLQAQTEQPAYLEPLNENQTTFNEAYYNPIEDEVSKVENINKVGNKRTHEYSETAVIKKKVIDNENIESSNETLEQDTNIVNYFTEAELQLHIDEALKALGQEPNPSLEDLIDLDEFLKQFDG